MLFTKERLRIRAVTDVVIYTHKRYFCENYRSCQQFHSLFSTVKIMQIFLTKNGLGYILGDFFTNSSGHPGSMATARERKSLKCQGRGFESPQGSWVCFCSAVISWLNLCLVLCSLKKTEGQSHCPPPPD
jgi:hypothetical protein